VSFGMFDCIFNAALVGMFLSVWRRSSFMPRDVSLTAAAFPAKRAVPAPPTR
jgi:hypothetical protein